MRLHPAWGLVLFFLSALAASSLASGAEPATGAPEGYERRNLEGFTVYVNRQVLTHNADGFGRRPLDVLERELGDLKRILVPKIVAVLQDVPVWAEWDDSEKDRPGVLARYFYGTADGLSKFGVDPRKLNCIEVLSLRRLAEIRRPGTALQQIIILHEMAHAVQHRILGMENLELETIYQQAMERKLYQQVNDRFGRSGKAYASTTAAEYFAELSCAYLDSCNYFPFNNEQLKGYDPVGYKFVERVWTQPERFNFIAKPKTSVSVASPAEAQSVTVIRNDIYAERDAMMKLDQLKVLIRQGHKEPVKKGLDELARTFPRTEAAKEARKLLLGLQ
jgi:hypothetical protein